ncbi:hypothetical protein [Sphingobacterium sp. HMA12]|uniref:hypothetical protein n=1 Tax=Sphingobacterium sp. HMA12 TaxID=2050894 RepID=UPI000CEA42D2|nr:hypothetical protein [Sphingobacterium sp. HMA12]
MNANLSYIKKLTVIATKTLLKHYLLAILSTVFYLVVGYLLLRSNSEGSFFSMRDHTQTIGKFLWLIGLILLPILLFLFSNKYVFSTVAGKVVEERQDDLIIPALDKVLLVFQSNQPDIVQNAGDYTFAKLKLINQVKNTQIENPWIKRIVVFGLNKIKFDSLDLDNNNSFYDLVKSKFIAVLEILTEADNRPFWICITIQWLIVLLIWFVG